MSDLRERIEKAIDLHLFTYQLVNDDDPIQIGGKEKLLDAITHEIGSCGECEKRTTCQTRINRIFQNKDIDYKELDKTNFCSDFKREGK